MADEDALVLLHALGMSPRVWDGVRPWLEPHRAVVALTALGHRGGAPAARRPGAGQRRSASSASTLQAIRDCVDSTLGDSSVSACYEVETDQTFAEQPPGLRSPAEVRA